MHNKQEWGDQSVTPFVLFPYHLALQVTGHIGDMYPTSITLPNQLGEAYLSLPLHLLYELEQATMVSLVARDNVGSTAEHVMAVLHAPNERVEFLAAVATGNHDGLTPRLAYGGEKLVY